MTEFSLTEAMKEYIKASLNDGQFLSTIECEARIAAYQQRRDELTALAFTLGGRPTVGPDAEKRAKAIASDKRTVERLAAGYTRICARLQDTLSTRYWENAAREHDDQLTSKQPVGLLSGELYSRPEPAFVAIEDNDGDLIYMNPAHVRAVIPAPTGERYQTLVLFGERREANLRAKEDVATVVRRLHGEEF
jgi:hypothetical protein